MFCMRNLRHSAQQRRETGRVPSHKQRQSVPLSSEASGCWLSCRLKFFFLKKNLWNASFFFFLSSGFEWLKVQIGWPYVSTLEGFSGQQRREIKGNRSQAEGAKYKWPHLIGNYCLENSFHVAKDKHYFFTWGWYAQWLSYLPADSSSRFPYLST